MPAQNIPSTSLHVDVLNVKGEAIKDAKVTLRPTDSNVKETALAYDDGTAAYLAKEVSSGTYEVEVSRGSLEGQSREVTVGVAPSRELFVLGERGRKTYFREKVRVPVNADPELFAVTIDRKARADRKFLELLAANLRLEPQKVPELAEKAGVHLFRLRGANAEQTLARISEHPLIEHAGAVVSMREHGFSFLTREIVVRFRGPRAEAVAAIAREYGYTVVRELVYAPHAWVLRWNKPATLEILDSIEKIAARDDVEWAEPSLVVTPEVDSIIPTDFLWPGLWDRQLIGVQDAWQHLHDAALDTFGDPDILFAVWDSGVQSAMGAPTNGDFQGNISNGQPKVLTAFDFDNMVANNDNPWQDHGSGVAGVSVAIANNPAPVAGPAYGLVGSAPNVQIMTLEGRIPYIDIEVADQYVWMAGFDPHSPLVGFPPLPPPRGADVITCSLTPGAGAPLSGTARATLDFVTTFGRGGKGTICFFSTGNANMNNVMFRPYSAYEKCLGIAGTSLGDDGVTEIRYDGSGWGQIALCAPTQDALATGVHNPPATFMPWGAEPLASANLISYATAQTTMTAATAAGANTLTVASVAGFAANGVIYIGGIGVWGSEPSKITSVNAMTNQLTLNAGVLNAHPAGEIIMTGPANHRNNFGGTSSATPLCAGVAALVLSAKPALTYIEARQILRDTAVKFDLANTDPVGQWLDANGNPSVMSGLPPVKSGWYGYGRVNAAAAVQTALTFATSRDLMIRDNLSDTGAVASSGPFWDSPDIWCRRLSPGTDPGALPANYGTAGPHEDPVRGQSNWIYTRVRNNGTDASFDAWVRISVTHWPGVEFTYPASFQPTNGPGDPLPSPMTPGTYFIGEAKVTGLAPGADQIVNVEWLPGLIPPDTVMVGMSTVHWHPCLLVEVTPHDGPVPTGNHISDDNNLGQKNLTIVDTDAGQDFKFATVIGNRDNLAEYLVLEINRGPLPREVELYVNLLDPLLRRRLRTFDESKEEVPAGTFGEAQWVKSVAARRSWRTGWYQSQEVVFLLPQRKVRVPIVAGKGRITPLVVGGIVGKGARAGTYEVALIQRQPDGHISGSAALQLKIGQG